MTVARIALVTVSDRSARGDREDASGPALAAEVVAAGHEVVSLHVVSDDESGLAELLRDLCDARDGPDVVITSGGTGLSPRDRAPEATARIADRRVPGIAEAVRAASRDAFPFADLSRGMAVTRGASLVVNLPGSPGGARDGWRVLAPLMTHAAEQLRSGRDHHPPDPGRGARPLR